jgi:DNA helicase-2/ATP-dependent DNA helicase PcrA
MRAPTPDQRAVLERKDARVRVVRAAPGSGKTWLVAEAIREALGAWSTKTAGIAALSFTRVGGQEIRKAVGYDLGHPHFVGTIDAFLFRFVVRPFFQRVFPNYASPRIVAGEWGADHWKFYARNKSTTLGSGKINLFGCLFIGEGQDGKAIIAHKAHWAQPLSALSAADAKNVEGAKSKMWQKCGLLTHSDAALVASKILGDQIFGTAVRAEVIRRFPFLIVDELQDAGHFLGKSVRLILEDIGAGGMLVGDPDQAIFEFNGARPDLFNTFEGIRGAVRMNLSNSQRCPSSIATAANYLKSSIGVLGPAPNGTGRALLVRYNDMVVDVQRLVRGVRARGATGTLKVIARATATVDELVGRHTGDAPPLYCRPITYVHRAVVAFRRSKNIAALAYVRAGLETAIFDHELVNDEELASLKVDPLEWKQLAIRCLLKANAIPAEGTFFKWQTDVGQMIDHEVSRFGLDSMPAFATGKLRPQNRKGSQDPSAKFLPQPGSSGQTYAGMEVNTVHGVKGETHDVTVFVCPATAAGHCPSVVWWSPDEKDREERRIAYVAMTRTRGDLIICVSEECYVRLAARHAAFVRSFECMTVDECIVSLRQNTITSFVTTTDLAPNEVA